MGIGQFQFGGLASGLDTGAIISAILDLERRPIRLLESQRASEQNRLDLIGTFEGLVKDLQERARDLSARGEFLANSLSVGNEGVATFSVSSSATTGTHELEVLSLAKADRYSFAAVADPEASLGTGSFTFDYDGQSYQVDLTGGADSLNDLASGINGATAGRVQASVVNTGTEASPAYQLVLAGADTGADFTIDNLSNTIGGLSDGTRITVAENASVLVDGLAVERSNNVFSDVIEGVSFTVNQELASTTFSVDTDVEGIKENLQDFVDAYNEVARFISNQNEFSEENGPGGALFGDSILSSVRGALQSALFSVDLATVQADTEGFSTLGLVGLDLQADGTLTIDDARVDERLATNIDAFADLFTDATDGVLTKLETAIDGLTSSTVIDEDLTVPGLFDNRRDAIDSRIGDIDDNIERQEARLERLEASLVQRFAALEELVGSLNAQGSFLSQNNAFPQGNR